MWISRLKLTNFKCYASQAFVFPQPAENKNLVLIGGMNGFGKTTILESIYLCLYGDEAIKNLISAGINITDGNKGRGYPGFLKRTFNREATNLGYELMSVEIQVLEDHDNGFEIERKWFFNKNGDFITDQEEKLVRSISNGTSKTEDEQDLREILDADLVPAHLAPFFFFDGEEVKTLATPANIEQIKRRMESLLGVTHLTGLRDRLKKYQTANRSINKIKSIDEEKYKSIEDKLDQNRQELQDLEERKEAIEDKLSTQRPDRENLMDRIQELVPSSGISQDIKEIINRQGKLEEELSDCENKIHNILTNILPFNMVREECKRLLKKQLRSEIDFSEWDLNKKSMDPKKESFISNVFNQDEPEITPALEGTQEHSIRARLNSAWEKLFHPPPHGCAEKIVHSYITNEKREHILSSMQQYAIGTRDVRALIEKESSLDNELNDMGKRIRREEDDHSGEISSLRKKLRQLNESIERSMIEKGDIDRHISSLKATINQDSATHERMRDQMVKASPAKSNIAKAERVIKLIDELKPRLYSLKTKQLSEATTKVYKELAHKSKINKIEISETGAVKFISANDKDDTGFERSAGENQLFATALLAGLASVSGIRAPLVVDTPLARLDSKHRKNILNFWIKQKDRQVILLAQDKEIDPSMLSVIGNSVCKKYLLEYEDIENGMGRASACENKYFEDTH